MIGSSTPFLFNKQAVQFYETGQGERAFALFHESLQAMLKSGYVNGPPSSLGALPTASDSLIASMLQDDERLSDTTDDEEACPEPRSPSRPCVSTTPSDPQHPCLFCQAFDHTGTHHPVVHMAADLYNMALVLQRGWVPRCLDQWKRCEILYRSAGELLWQMLGYRMLACPATSMLYCAILNNLAVGARQEHATVYLQTLEQYCAMARFPQRTTFELNVLVLRQPRTVAGAA